VSPSVTLLPKPNPFQCIPRIFTPAPVGAAVNKSFPRNGLPSSLFNVTLSQQHPVLRHSSHQSTPPEPDPRQPLHNEMQPKND